MAINLEKGQREKINIPSFKVGLGWDSNESATGEAFDVDASVFLLGSDGKLISDNHFVFFCLIWLLIMLLRGIIPQMRVQNY